MENQKIIKDGSIWVKMNETTITDGRYIANIIVWKLSTEPSKIFLLGCKEWKKYDYKTLFNNAIGVLWPNGIRHNNVLLLLTGTTPCTSMCGKTVEHILSKNDSLNLFSVHGFHRVAEQ